MSDVFKNIFKDVFTIRHHEKLFQRFLHYHRKLLQRCHHHNQKLFQRCLHHHQKKLRCLHHHQNVFNVVFTIIKNNNQNFLHLLITRQSHISQVGERSLTHCSTSLLERLVTLKVVGRDDESKGGLSPCCMWQFIIRKEINATQSNPLVCLSASLVKTNCIHRAL